MDRKTFGFVDKVVQNYLSRKSENSLIVSYDKLSIKDLYFWQIFGKTFVIRVDFNVPKDKKTGEITDIRRITAAEETIKYITSRGGKVVLVSHFGRPDGAPVKKHSLETVATKCEEIFKKKVIFPKFFEKGYQTFDSYFDQEVVPAVNKMKRGEILLVENIRFDPREEANDNILKSKKYVKNALPEIENPEFKDQINALFNIDGTKYQFKSNFSDLLEASELPLEIKKKLINLFYISKKSLAEKLASIAHYFISDAFGAAHRAHSSTKGITKYLKAFAGLLIKTELDAAHKGLANPKHPLAAIVGGAKVSDKISVLENLINKGVDDIIIGGGMAYAFLKAQGKEIGISLFNEGDDIIAANILKLAKEKGVKIHIPIDHMVNREFDNEFKEGVPTEAVKDIPADMMGLDIGPETINYFSGIIAKSKTIIWNGPMGVFEMENFKNGTYAIAKAIAMATKKGAFSIVGGGDSASAAEKSGYAQDMSHISTGGGAMLELMEGKDLPGIAALNDKEYTKFFIAILLLRNFFRR